jgi:2-hydroxyacyl-CoA lyase 1
MVLINCQVVNSSGNCFPLLLIAGSSSTTTLTKGDFQESDHISLLRPHVKTAIRPPTPQQIPDALRKAYRISLAGRPGPTFVDIPADFLWRPTDPQTAMSLNQPLPTSLPSTPEHKARHIAGLLRSAKAPLVLIGKGAAYARAEADIRELINRTHLPFLSSPMGVGVIPHSHPCNTASARSAALKHADVVLVLGARLNWIFHFGEPPKWNANAKFIVVNVDPEEIGNNAADQELGVVADVKTFVPHLLSHLSGFVYPSSTPYWTHLSKAKHTAETALAHLSSQDKIPMTFEHAYSIMRTTLDRLSPPEQGGTCFVAEGARTMDLSRAYFGTEHPRLRLDAGTHGTMGVGMGYAVAAWEAYNGLGASPASSGQKKKIVCIIGDSAFGFSGFELETMARFGMDVLIFVMNNGGVYHGHADSRAEFELQRRNSKEGRTAEGLRSWSLGCEVGYEKFAEGMGAKGFVVRTGKKLERAAVEGFGSQVSCSD